MPLRTGVTVATTQANEGDHSYFVRVDIPAPVGTHRFTDRPVDISVNVGDGAGAQTWTSAYLIIGAIDQNNTDPLSVSSLSFANIDYTWTNWVMTLAGSSLSMRGAPCSVYRVWFTAAGAVDFVETLYQGIIDEHHLGVTADLSLAPFNMPWARETPWQTYAQLDPMWAKLMPDRTTTIYWGGRATPPTPGTGAGGGAVSGGGTGGAGKPYSGGGAPIIPPPPRRRPGGK